MLDLHPGLQTSLMDEVASVASAHASESVPVRLVNVGVSSVSFISPVELSNPVATPLSLRFSLPGKPRLHFASVTLAAAPVRDASGYQYTAKFATIDPHTVDHIVQVLNPAPVSAP